MNTCILSGNLGEDPIVTFSSEGMPIATFSMAFKSTKDKTNWVKVTSFNKTAEVVEKYLHKGAKVAVTGLLDKDTWETDGVKKSTFKVIANSIEFIKTDGRGFPDSNNQG